MKKVYLILEDGTYFEGTGFGADIPAIGELVFTTGMCGYIETLTDPSYYGQIVLQTFPLIGNYGIIEEDFEGECAIRGYVVREWCDQPSNFRCEYNIDKFLKDKNIPGIYGIDTREVTKIIRERGVMNAVITDKLPEETDFIRAYSIKDAVMNLTCREKYVITPDNVKYKVALIDYGARGNIIRSLIKRDCEVTVYPADTSAEEIISSKPNGIMLSNGPGDPAENTYCIDQIKKLVGKLPIFGICLGHQLLALAYGGETVKLKYGHRGTNQPVREINGKRTYITSQNHGYSVVTESLKKGEVSFVNANDGTCEGVNYPGLNAFSVQFNPETCSAPTDASYLFDRFLSAMET